MIDYDHTYRVYEEPTFVRYCLYDGVPTQDTLGKKHQGDTLVWYGLAHSVLHGSLLCGQSFPVPVVDGWHVQELEQNSYTAGPLCCPDCAAALERWRTDQQALPVSRNEALTIIGKLIEKQCQALTDAEFARCFRGTCSPNGNRRIAHRLVEHGLLIEAHQIGHGVQLQMDC